MADNNVPAAELRGICKQFPGSSSKKANSNISLDLKAGEILCIAGENGAGKTTLMKILSGLEKPTSGEIYIHGKKAQIDSPLAAKKLGIGMVHQHSLLFPEYTVAENIVMGLEPRKWGLFFDTQKAEATAAKIINEQGFSIESGRTVGDLGAGEKQQVEICRMLYRNADILILDEPTSVLTEQETASLFKTLKTLASAGKSLILITHKLREIKLVCDRVAVLRRGELVGIQANAGFDEYEIARMMVGNSDGGPAHKYPRTPPARTHTSLDPVIVFDDVTVLRRGQKRPLLDRVSFSVRPAEILGFTGVGGNGLGVLEAVLGGFLHPASGRILHGGRDISSLNIRRLRNQGLAYVPADRLAVGSALGATMDENSIINRRGEFRRGFFLDRKAIRYFSGELAGRYNISGEADKEAATLSGGNLQKLILAREIDWLRDYIVFSEPTWGLDIASSGFVWEQIDAIRGKGAAVILVSTNLDEVLRLADRIMVMYRGRIAGEFENSGEASIKDGIGACMQGLSIQGRLSREERE